MDDAARARLVAWLTAAAGAPVSIEGMALLSGGAIQQNWAMDVSRGGAPERWVLRTDNAAVLAVSLPRATEFDRIANAMLLLMILMIPSAASLTDRPRGRAIFSSTALRARWLRCASSTSWGVATSVRHITVSSGIWSNSAFMASPPLRVSPVRWPVTGGVRRRSITITRCGMPSKNHRPLGTSERGWPKNRRCAKSVPLASSISPSSHSSG